MAEKVLEVKDLKVTFKSDHGLVQAVRNVSFDLYKGETLCIVGESGSGKSVTSKTIMQILSNNAIVESGTIMYEGENLLEISEDEFYKIRGHKIGMIFQDPLSSLNPIVRIGKQITEATLINADKLKQMYEDLISKEKIAYKNTIAHTQILIKKERDAFELLQRKEKERLAKFDEDVASRKSEAQSEYSKAVLEAKTNGDFSEERNKALKEEVAYKVKALNEEYKNEVESSKKLISDAKATLNSNIKKYNEELASVLPPFKEAYDKKRKEAKVTVKEYAEKIKADYKKEVSDIKAQTSDKKELKEKLAKAKEAYIDKTRVTKKEAKRRALEIMKEVGIPMPERRFKQYPFEFSGGMRQRIVIAIALTANPRILICDEPTTALDVTIQAQILELINRLKKERDLSCIFITHDLGVVANMADRVAVMYAGKIVEYGTAEDIFYDPRHPYTWALLSSIPDINSKERLEAIPGTPPDMIYPPKGDAFALRSKYAMNIDFKEQPPFFKVSDTHYAATWLLHPNAPKVEMPKIVSDRIKNSLKGAE